MPSLDKKCLGESKCNPNKGCQIKIGIQNGSPSFYKVGVKIVLLPGRDARSFGIIWSIRIKGFLFKLDSIDESSYNTKLSMS